jgi:hypothetical protein
LTSISHRQWPKWGTGRWFYEALEALKMLHIPYSHFCECLGPTTWCKVFPFFFPNWIHLIPDLLIGWIWERRRFLPKLTINISVLIAIQFGKKKGKILHPVLKHTTFPNQGRDIHKSVKEGYIPLLPSTKDLVPQKHGGEKTMGISKTTQPIRFLLGTS